MKGVNNMFDLSIKNLSKLGDYYETGWCKGSRPIHQLNISFRNTPEIIEVRDALKDVGAFENLLMVGGWCAISIVTDNEISGYLIIHDSDLDDPWMKANSFAFYHEIGHILGGHLDPGCEIPLIQRELDADEFAFNNLKSEDMFTLYEFQTMLYTSISSAYKEFSVKAAAGFDNIFWFLAKRYREMRKRIPRK